MAPGLRQEAVGVAGRVLAVLVVSLVPSVAQFPGIHTHPLREPEVEDILRYVLEGGAMYPLSVLRPEGSPFR